MTITPETEAHGPVDFVLLEFPVEGLTGQASEELVKLVEQGVIRLFDLLVVMKNDDGSVEALELTDPGGPVAGFSDSEGARTGLLGDDDIAEATAAVPGTVAALIVYENIWAAPFVAAVRDSGGELIASTRIPAPDVMEALDALEAQMPSDERHPSAGIEPAQDTGTMRQEKNYGTYQRYSTDGGRCRNSAVRSAAGSSAARPTSSPRRTPPPRPSSRRPTTSRSASSTPAYQQPAYQRPHSRSRRHQRRSTPAAQGARGPEGARDPHRRRVRSPESEDPRT